MLSLLAAGALLLAACDDPAMDTTADPMMPGQTADPGFADPLAEPGFGDPLTADPVTDPLLTDDFGGVDDALYGDDGMDAAFAETPMADEALLELAKQDASEALAALQVTVEQQDFEAAAVTVDEVREALADAYEAAPEALQAEWEALEAQFETLQAQLEAQSLEALETLEALIGELELSAATGLN